MKKKKALDMRWVILTLRIVLMLVMCACKAEPDNESKGEYEDQTAVATEPSHQDMESPADFLVGAWRSDDYLSSVLVLNEDAELYWVGIGSRNATGTLGYLLEGTWRFSNNMVVFDGVDYDGETVHREFEYRTDDDMIILDNSVYTRWNIKDSDKYSFLGDWHVYRPGSEYTAFKARLNVPNKHSGVNMWGEQLSFYSDGSYCARMDNGDLEDEYSYGTYEKVFGGTAVRINAGNADGIFYIKPLGCGIMILSSAQDDESSYLFYKIA